MKAREGPSDGQLFLNVAFLDPFADSKDTNLDFADHLVMWGPTSSHRVALIYSQLRPGTLISNSRDEGMEGKDATLQSDEWECLTTGCRKLSADHGDQTMLRHVNTHGSDSETWASRCKVTSRPDAHIRHLRSHGML